MTDIQLLIDFGSTFTKVVAVDLERVEVLATSRVPSTVATDVTIGLEEALSRLSHNVRITDDVKSRALACSSAAGGLRIVCIGFVTELTSKAANLAALGAGGKVVAGYSYKLSDREIAEVESLAPDIVLLAGGTDGGDEETIIHNARKLARTCDAVKHIIVAGNKTAYDEIARVFSGTPKHVIYSRNVMPEIGVLDVAPCREEIRRIFMQNIVEAKGIAKARSLIRDIIMPTPSAVLEAAGLIARALGEVMVIDPGGATTDVHSIARGNPSRPDVIFTGLPEPYEKRTVEGDLGLKYNLDRLLELAKERLPVEFPKIAGSMTEGIPQTPEELFSRRQLARLMVEVATERHAGRLEAVYTPAGERLIQHGKDLTGVKSVIGTGGPIVFADRPREVLEGAAYSEARPFILKPREPRFYLDTEYILFAVGLLARSSPGKALELAQKYLKPI
ncbi:MAG: methylaspartate mutase accessory protein GlmL [Dehalococcoidales bacterium]|nr:methylaspartate mutase accessory protein GlmL [Dehalococcoidales bacterium]